MTCKDYYQSNNGIKNSEDGENSDLSNCSSSKDNENGKVRRGSLSPGAHPGLTKIDFNKTLNGKL